MVVPVDLAAALPVASAPVVAPAAARPEDSAAAAAGGSGMLAARRLIGRVQEAMIGRPLQGMDFRRLELELASL